MKLLQMLGQAYLGLETRKYYSEERNFIREHIIDTREMNKRLHSSRSREIKEIVFGQVVPTAAEIGAAIYGYVTNDIPAVYVIAGIAEGVRWKFAYFDTKMHEEGKFIDKGERESIYRELDRLAEEDDSDNSENGNEEY